MNNAEQKFIDWMLKQEDFETDKDANLSRKSFLAGFEAAQQSVQSDGAYCRCGNVGYGDKLNRCVTCGQFKTPRR